MRTYPTDRTPGPDFMGRPPNGRAGKSELDQAREDVAIPVLKALAAALTAAELEKLKGLSLNSKLRVLKEILTATKASGPAVSIQNNMVRPAGQRWVQARAEAANPEKLAETRSSVQGYLEKHG